MEISGMPSPTALPFGVFSKTHLNFHLSHCILVEKTFSVWRSDCRIGWFWNLNQGLSESALVRHGLYSSVVRRNMQKTPET
jgi:hypothetical protein